MPRHLASISLITLAALDLAPSVAHVLEAPPRLWVWPLELWREATVFHGQFAVDAPVGAVLEVATILGCLGFAFSWRHDRAVLPPAAAAGLLFALGLVLWFALVSPANAVLSTWVPGPVPTNAEAVRWRWETGHAVVAAVKLLALAMLAVATQRAAATKVLR